uniref:sensor histidine kinase n=1 Tax=Eisenbergiella tayi TaxID=1432052 RepID=UPI003FD8266E
MKLRIFWSSLKVKVLFAAFVTCIPILILFFWMNYHSIGLIQQHIYENNLDILNLNMKQLDSELMKVSGYLVNESSSRQDIDQFASPDEIIRYNVSIQYNERLKENIQLYNYMEGMMYYSAVSNNRIYSFTDYSTSYPKRMKIMDYITSHVDEMGKGNSRWETYEIDGDYVLICAIGNEKALFCAWTTYETLLVPTLSWKLANNSYSCFTSQDGIVRTPLAEEKLNTLDYNGDLSTYYFTGERKQYLMTGVESAAGDFRMMNAVDRMEMLGPFYIIRIAGIVAFFVFLFVLAPFLIGFLNKSIFFPIHRMEQGISRVEKGDLEVRIENKKSSRELSHLIDSFNSMVEQIKTLKIQSYEDELEKQDLQLNYLQLQIEPHFYLNALNLINTMAQMGDCAMIRELTENLSLYLRYIVSTRSGCTTIRQEMDHIGHYLKIMEIRFGDSFQYMEEIDERVMDKKIPPLLIQMLVENSMKYAFDIYGNTQIRLKVSQECQDVVIVVEDNGSGYPKEILNCFEGGIQPEGNQIGLWNIRMRLEHMYRNRTSFQISNIEPQGARTEIRIKGEVE